jgi:hypothetical protein
VCNGETVSRTQVGDLDYGPSRMQELICQAIFSNPKRSSILFSTFSVRDEVVVEYFVFTPEGPGKRTKMLLSFADPRNREEGPPLS